jgi:acetyl esterase/lipase
VHLTILSFGRAVVVGLASVALSGCLRLGLFAANAPAYFGSYDRTADIAYGADPQQRLDIYKPRHGSSAKPIVVFWHGGRWSFGDKSEYRFVAAALCDLGYVVVVPNYRHYPQVKMPGFMQDAAQAAVWAAGHAADFGADPKRLYFMGHSAGAQMAALLALDQRYLTAAGKPDLPVAGVIGLSGPYDFLPLTEDDTRDMFGPPDLYPLSQPINFARAGAPPMLLLHGEADETVRPKNSRNLAAALSAKGVLVTLRVYPKLKHADTVAALSAVARGRAPVVEEIRKFVSGAGAWVGGN